MTTTRKNILQPIIREQVEAGSAVFTDAHESYLGLAPDYVHGVIDHAEAYLLDKFTPTAAKISGRS